MTHMEAAKIIMNPCGCGTSKRSHAERMAPDALTKIATGKQRLL